MMLSELYPAFMMRLATVIGPIAVYFLVLGLLNSRRHPQLLSGRQDFALLVLALSPLLFLPAISYFGTSLPALALLAVIFVAGILLLGPREHSWVIYNAAADEVRQAVGRSLQQMAVDYKQDGNLFIISENNIQLRLCEFPLLKNVTIKLSGRAKEFAARLDATLPRVLCRHEAQTSPMAVALMLVATAMLIAPVSMMAQSMPEIVRLVTDLIH